MNKKIKTLSLILSVLLLLLGLAACGNSGSKGNNIDSKQGQDGEQVAAPAENEGFSGIVPVYTPPSGNTLYVLSAGLSNMINQSNEILPNVQLSTQATNGDTGAIEQLALNYAESKPAFSAVTSIAASKAYEGKLDAEVPIERTEIRAVANLGINAVHLVVKANSDIQTYADLKGKTLGGFAPNVGPRYFIEDLLSEMFNVQEDDYHMIPLSNQDRVDSIKNGSVDAVFLLGNPPSPLVTELIRTDDIRVIPLEEEKMKEFTEKHPYYSYVNIPAGTYAGIDEDMTIGALGVMYVTHEATDDELVYQLVKMMIEEPEQVKQIHPSFDIRLDNVSLGTDLTFHPGAKKYFEENGLNVD